MERGSGSGETLRLSSGLAPLPSPRKLTTPSKMDVDPRGKDDEVPNPHSRQFLSPDVGYGHQLHHQHHVHHHHHHQPITTGPFATNLERVPSVNRLQPQSSTETSGLGETITSGFSSQESVHSAGNYSTPVPPSEEGRRCNPRPADNGRSLDSNRLADTATVNPHPRRTRQDSGGRSLSPHEAKELARQLPSAPSGRRTQRNTIDKREHDRVQTGDAKLSRHNPTPQGGGGGRPGPKVDFPDDGADEAGTTAVERDARAAGVIKEKEVDRRRDAVSWRDGSVTAAAEGGAAGAAAERGGSGSKPRVTVVAGDFDPTPSPRARHRHAVTADTVDSGKGCRDSADTGNRERYLPEFRSPPSHADRERERQKEAATPRNGEKASSFRRQKDRGGSLRSHPREKPERDRDKTVQRASSRESVVRSPERTFSSDGSRDSKNDGHRKDSPLTKDQAPRRPLESHSLADNGGVRETDFIDSGKCATTRDSANLAGKENSRERVSTEGGDQRRREKPPEKHKPKDHGAARAAEKPQPRDSTRGRPLKKQISRDSGKGYSLESSKDLPDFKAVEEAAPTSINDAEDSHEREVKKRSRNVNQVGTPVRKVVRERTLERQQSIDDQTLHDPEATKSTSHARSSKQKPSQEKAHAENNRTKTHRHVSRDRTAVEKRESSPRHSSRERVPDRQTCKEKERINEQEVSPARISKDSRRREVSPARISKDSRRKEVSPARISKDSRHREVSPARISKDSRHREVSPARISKDNRRREVSPARISKDSRHREVSPARISKDSRRREVSPARISKDSRRSEETKKANADTKPDNLSKQTFKRENQERFNREEHIPLSEFRIEKRIAQRPNLTGTYFARQTSLEEIPVREKDIARRSRSDVDPEIQISENQRTESGKKLQPKVRRERSLDIQSRDDETRRLHRDEDVSNLHSPKPRHIPEQPTRGRRHTVERPLSETRQGHKDLSSDRISVKPDKSRLPVEDVDIRVISRERRPRHTEATEDEERKHSVGDRDLRGEENRTSDKYRLARSSSRIAESRRGDSEPYGQDAKDGSRYRQPSGETTSGRNGPRSPRALEKAPEKERQRIGSGSKPVDRHKSSEPVDRHKSSKPVLPAVAGRKGEEADKRAAPGTVRSREKRSSDTATADDIEKDLPSELERPAAAPFRQVDATKTEGSDRRDKGGRSPGLHRTQLDSRPTDSPNIRREATDSEPRYRTHPSKAEERAAVHTAGRSSGDRGAESRDRKERERRVRSSYLPEAGSRQPTTSHRDAERPHHSDVLGPNLQRISAEGHSGSATESKEKDRRQSDRKIKAHHGKGEIFETDEGGNDNFRKKRESGRERTVESGRERTVESGRREEKSGQSVRRLDKASHSRENEGASDGNRQDQQSVLDERGRTTRTAAAIVPVAMGSDGRKPAGQRQQQPPRTIVTVTSPTSPDQVFTDDVYQPQYNGDGQYPRQRPRAGTGDEVFDDLFSQAKNIKSPGPGGGSGVFSSGLQVEEINSEWERRESRGSIRSIRSRSSQGGSFRSRSGSTRRSRKGLFLGVNTESAWTRWSRDRRASFRRRIELLEKPDENLARVSTPVRKARQEGLKFVHPDLEGTFLSEEDLNELRRHKQQKYHAIRVIEKSRKSKFRIKTEVHLTAEQWQVISDFWEHPAFIRGRYLGLVLMFLSFVVMVVSITHNHWVSYEAWNLTVYEGLWINCSTPILPLGEQTCTATEGRGDEQDPRK